MEKNIYKKIVEYKKKDNNAAILKLLHSTKNINKRIYSELLEKYQKNKKNNEIVELCEIFEKNTKDQLPSQWISAKAIALINLNRTSEAKKTLKSGVEKNENDAEINHNLSVCLANLGEWDEALIYSERANLIHPNHTAILGNLGRIQIALKNTEEAKKIFKKIIEVEPNLVEGYNGMGAAYLIDYDLTHAIENLEKAHSLDPLNSSTLGNLGVAYKILGQYDKARLMFETAINQEQNNTEHHWNLALLDLLLGNYERGWKEYEWRYHPNRTTYDRVTKPDINIPMLTNLCDVKGKVVGMMSEQGYGDNIQFSRYAEYLKNEGATVVIMTPDPLIPIMQTLPWADVVCNRWSTCPKLDYWVYPMSLPQRYKTQINNIPNKVPYLFAQNSKVKKWADKLGIKKKKLRIGIVWAGKSGHGNDKNRSMHLENFKSIIENNEIEYISLQTGERSDEAVQGINIEKIGNEIKTFEDTAAILTQLDLLITVDSAPAHLAGAMNCPVWVLLPYNPDFRWLLNRKDSPWYSSNMRLYRQTKQNDWSDVIREIKNDVNLLVHKKSQRNVIIYPDIAWSVYETNIAGTIPLLQVAIWHHQKKELDIAENIYKFVLKYLPNNNDALRNLAVCLRAQGKIIEAEDCYKKCLDINENDAVTHANFANLLADLKRMDQAEFHSIKAIKLDPYAHNAWYILSVIYQHHGENNKANDAIDNALKIEPKNVTYITMKGINLIKRKKLKEAEYYLNEAYQIDKNHPEMLIGKAQLATEQGYFEEALTVYTHLLDNSISLDQSTRTEILNSRAMTYARMGLYERAVEDAKLCVSINPNNPDAHFNLAIYQLTIGNYENGWIEYEWRYHHDRKAHDRIVPLKLNSGKQWQGENLIGKKILISPEQGHGDNIQFMRYSKLLKERGAKVYILTAESLYELFSMQNWQDGVYTDLNKLPEVDYWTLPLSLPNQFRTTVNSIPAEIPYIHVYENKLKMWKKCLEETGLLNKPLIVIVNSGSPSHSNDKNRSIDINSFESLIDQNKFNYAVIEYNPDNCKKTIKCGNFKLINLGSMIKNFTDTAAIFHYCKYIISVDTANLHLAGAMGLPCIGLIPSTPDWRWMLHRNDTPWYPGMKIIRQDKNQNWDLVIKKLKNTFLS